MAHKIETTEQTPVVVIREGRFPGSWGKGATVAEAAAAIRRHGARNGAVVYAFAASQNARINEMGNAEFDARGPLYLGKLHARGVTITEVYDANPKVAAAEGGQ